MDKSFFEVYRRKGFSDTLKILFSVEDRKILQSKFFEKLNETSYLNAYFRVKDDLIDCGLIEFSLGKKDPNDKIDSEKMIGLTEFGVEFTRKLCNLEIYWEKSQSELGVKVNENSD